MAIPDSEMRRTLKAVGAFLEKRRRVSASEPSLRANISNSEVVILASEVDSDDDRKSREYPVARIRWFNSRKIWRLFWVGDDRKWHAYYSYPEAARIATHLRTVDEVFLGSDE
jgi:hypothetical protein